MKIKPYTFAVKSNGDFFFIESIKKRRIEGGLLPDKIACGIAIKNKSCVGIEGKTTKNYLGLRTANFQDVSNFIYNNSSICEKSSWIQIDEIQGIVEREDFEFTVKDEIPKI